MITKRRNLVVLVLIIALIPASLLMANGQEEKSEDVVLDFWYFHSDAEGDFMESLAADYSENTQGVTVKTKNIPQSEYLGASLTTAFASGKGPDIFLISPGDFLKYANSGIAMDLTPYFSPEIRSDFLDSAIEAVTVNNKIVGVPFEIELLGLYYNKQMFAQAGLTPPKTWSEFVSATKALTTDNRYGSIIEPAQGYFQNFLWYPFLWQNGGQVIDADKMVSRFRGPEVEGALKLWRDLIASGAARSLTTGGWDASFIGDGTTAMQVSGTWIINSLENTYTDTDIGVVPLPIPAGGKAATDAGGWKFMVNSRSKNSDAAAKFIMWAMADNTEWPLKWCTEVKFAYSPRQSVIDAGKSLYNEGLRSVFTQDIYSSAIGEPRYPAEIVNIVGEALQQAMFTDKNIRKITEEADKKINAFLKDFDGSL